MSTTKQKPKTYSVHCHCSNCEHDCHVEVPFGKPVPEKMDCTNCGCKTATRKVVEVRPCPYPVPYPYPIYPPIRPREPWRKWLEDSRTVYTDSATVTSLPTNDIPRFGEMSHIRLLGVAVSPPELH